jgi:hypothetical protein
MTPMRISRFQTNGGLTMANLEALHDGAKFWHQGARFVIEINYEQFGSRKNFFELIEAMHDILASLSVHIVHLRAALKKRPKDTSELANLCRDLLDKLELDKAALFRRLDDIYAFLFGIREIMWAKC